MLSVGGWQSTLWRYGGPRKKLLWKPHAPAACSPTACVGVGDAVKVGRRTVADAVRKETPLLQAWQNAPF